MTDWITERIAQLEELKKRREIQRRKEEYEEHRRFKAALKRGERWAVIEQLDIEAEEYTRDARRDW